MISYKKNIIINPVLLTNIVFAFFPISFIFGNLITNINTLLFCCLGILHLRSRILTTKFNLSIKIIFLLFIIIFFSTSLNFIKSLYIDGYEYSELIRLLKSISFFRYFLMLIIVYLLSESDILNFKYFFVSAAFSSVFISLDIIFQYIFGFNIIGLKSFHLTLDMPISYFFRNSGFFGDELIAGGFIKNFSFFSIFFVAFIFKNKNNIRFLLIMLTICIVGMGILFSGNRMPLILFVFGLLLIFLLNNKLKKVLSVSLIVLFIIFGLLGSFDKKIKKNLYIYYGLSKYIIINLANISESRKSEVVKYDIPKEVVNKIFRLIANKTHPDKLINKKISDKEYEEKVTTYKEANTACDNRDWFKLKEIAKELNLNLSHRPEELEKSITEVESKINNIKNTYPWIWYHIEENQKEFVKPQIIEALKEKSKSDDSDDVS